MNNLINIAQLPTAESSVLIIEGENHHISSYRIFFEGAGYKVNQAFDEIAAKKLINNNRPSIIVIDITLPEDAMIKVCQSIRALYKGPIIMLTSNYSEQLQVDAFDAGIDDYLVKPISTAILTARVESLIRRSKAPFQQNLPTKLQVGDITLFPLAQKCEVNHKGVHLSTFEFRLLGLLLANVGQIMSRDSIYQTLLGREYNGEERTVDVRVSKLRDKLASVGLEQTKIETVWGKGYILTELAA